MKIFNDVRNYICDNNFQIITNNNLVNIQNYTDIDTINENIIIIKCNNIKIKINGKSLTIKKLLNDEFLINGKIISIIYEGENE